MPSGRVRVFLVIGSECDGLGMKAYIGLDIYDVNAVFDVDIGPAVPYIDVCQRAEEPMAYKIRTTPPKGFAMLTARAKWIVELAAAKAADQRNSQAA